MAEIKPDKMMDMFLVRHPEYREYDRKEIEKMIRSQFRYLKWMVGSGLLQPVRLKWIGRFYPSPFRVQQQVDKFGPLEKTEEQQIEFDNYVKFLDENN